MGKLNIKGYCRLGLRLTLLSLALLRIFFLETMFCLPFEYVTGESFQIANIVLSSVKKLNTNWQAVNLQHACRSRKNVILNERIKPRSWHPCFVVYNLNVDKTWAP